MYVHTCDRGGDGWTDAGGYGIINEYTRAQAHVTFSAYSTRIHLRGCGVTFRDARNTLRCASISPGINCTCRRADRFVTFMICVRADVAVYVQCRLEILHAFRTSKRCAASRILVRDVTYVRVSRRFVGVDKRVDVRYLAPTDCPRLPNLTSLSLSLFAASSISCRETQERRAFILN